jgi:hypothetical protein
MLFFSSSCQVLPIDTGSVLLSNCMYEGWRQLSLCLRVMNVLKSLVIRCIVRVKMRNVVMARRHNSFEHDLKVVFRIISALFKQGIAV